MWGKWPKKTEMAKEWVKKSKNQETSKVYQSTTQKLPTPRKSAF